MQPLCFRIRQYVAGGANWHGEVDVIAGFHAEEFRRSDSDDGERLLADGDGLTDYGRVGSEASTPVAIVDDGYRFVVGGQQSAQLGFDAKDFEVASGGGLSCSAAPSTSMRISSVLKATAPVKAFVSLRRRTKHAYDGAPEGPAVPAPSRKASSFGVLDGKGSLDGVDVNTRTRSPSFAA